MIAMGVKKFVEVGPGAVLAGLVKRIDKSVDVVSVNNVASLEALGN
jgi:[acyl-carrier-protein] S-malonyltransferase